jgi:hypothetical protein
MVLERFINVRAQILLGLSGMEILEDWTHCFDENIRESIETLNIAAMEVFEGIKVPFPLVYLNKDNRIMLEWSSNVYYKIIFEMCTEEIVLHTQSWSACFDWLATTKTSVIKEGAYRRLRARLKNIKLEVA